MHRSCNIYLCSMEKLLIIIILLLLFIIVAFIIAIFSRKCRRHQMHRTEFIGEEGEKIISTILRRLPPDYCLFDDLYFQSEEHYTQIDHVIISTFGVFVIETKNFKGCIYGSDEADFWTQKFYRTKFRFRNPIKQNYAHVMFLQSLFHISITAFIPIVVFIDRAMLMNKNRNHVIYASELRDFILKQTVQRLSSEETERLTQLIFSNNIQDKDRKCKHIAAVQKIIRDKDLMLAHRVCPKCGGRLVERQGKYANFLGCSNYPQCRFTTKLM